MKIIKNSLVGFNVLSLLVIGLATLLPRSTSGQGNSQNAPPHRDGRKFYITRNPYPANEALTACEEGYHMASMWEILQPSSLKYDTQRGATLADSGLGPPARLGWIRTGQVASGSNTVGVGNCQAWTSNTGPDQGTTVDFQVNWSSPALVISPWNAQTLICSSTAPVWCVED